MNNINNNIFELTITDDEGITYKIINLSKINKLYYLNILKYYNIDKGLNINNLLNNLDIDFMNTTNYNDNDYIYFTNNLLFAVKEIDLSNSLIMNYPLSIIFNEQFEPFYYDKNRSIKIDIPKTCDNKVITYLYYDTLVSMCQDDKLNNNIINYNNYNNKINNMNIKLNKIPSLNMPDLYEIIFTDNETNFTITKNNIFS
jgi:hypothetical protein